jgi:hypothetical protein
MMRILVVLCLIGLVSGCASAIRTARGVPETVVSPQPSALSGRYANLGLCHSPDANHPYEAYLTNTIGLTSYPEQNRGIVILRVGDESISFTTFSANEVPSETTLKKNLDYLIKDGGIEFTHASKGSGGEGIWSMNVTTRLLLCQKADGTLIVKASEDIKEVSGIIIPLPSRHTRELWYEFRKNG